jgi:hypothetical protein
MFSQLSSRNQKLVIRWNVACLEGKCTSVNVQISAYVIAHIRAMVQITIVQMCGVVKKQVLNSQIRLQKLKDTCSARCIDGSNRSLKK